MKKLLILTVSIFTVLSLFQCGNSKNEVNDDLIQNTISNFNYIGENHNSALDYLAEKTNPATAESEEKFTIISEFYLNTLTSQVEKDEFLNALTVYRNRKNYYEQEFLSFMEKGNAFTDNEKSIFYLLESTVNEGKTFQEIWDNIESIQEEIIIDKNSYPKYEILLSACSIAKYSSMYWFAVSENENHPFHYKFNLRECGLPCQIVKMVLADLAGYSDCMQNGGFGTLEGAQTVCQNQGAYSSGL